MTDERHAGRPRRAGVPLDEASGAVILLHGRGATAAGILALAENLDVSADDVAYLAPPADGNTWYPSSFLAPIEENEPWLTAALGAVDRTIETVAAAGIDRSSVLLIGFSQGACLASEYVARNATAYGGLAALSGGLIGPPGTERAYDGDLEGTPAFLGCSDVDPHIPLERVHETAAVLEDLGGDVTTRIYEGMGHGINDDELDVVAGMVDDIPP